MAGFRVRCTRATKLADELVEAANEKILTRTIARYGRVDLLRTVELGYRKLDRSGDELLFQVRTQREEKNGVAIASGGSFGGWTTSFTDPRLRAAIVDRVTFGGNNIETGAESCRLADAGAARVQGTRDDVPRKTVKLLVSSEPPQWEQDSPGDAQWTD